MKYAEAYGNQSGTIRTNCPLPASAAGQRQHSQLTGAQRHSQRSEHGCKWRGLPPRFGNWHTVYTRMNRCSKSGVLDRVFAALQEADILWVRLEVVAPDSASVKVRPHGMGRPEKGLQAIGKSRGGWNIKVHLVAADEGRAVTFALSPGEAHDAPEGRVLLCGLGPQGSDQHC